MADVAGLVDVIGPGDVRSGVDVAGGVDVADGADLASVTVRYFAAAAEAAGLEEETLAPGTAGTTIGELREWLVERYGAAMARVVANGSFLVDGVVQRDDAAPLGASVDVLPPFAGG